MRVLPVSVFSQLAHPSIIRTPPYTIMRTAPIAIRVVRRGIAPITYCFRLSIPELASDAALPGLGKIVSTSKWNELSSILPVKPAEFWANRKSDTWCKTRNAHKNSFFIEIECHIFMSIAKKIANIVFSLYCLYSSFVPIKYVIYHSHNRYHIARSCTITSWRWWSQCSPHKHTPSTSRTSWNC